MPTKLFALREFARLSYTERPSARTRARSGGFSSSPDRSGSPWRCSARGSCNTRAGTPAAKPRLSQESGGFREPLGPQACQQRALRGDVVPPLDRDPAYAADVASDMGWGSEKVHVLRPERRRHKGLVLTEHPLSEPPPRPDRLNPGRRSAPPDTVSAWGSSGTRTSKVESSGGPTSRRIFPSGEWKQRARSL